MEEMKEKKKRPSERGRFFKGPTVRLQNFPADKENMLENERSRGKEGKGEDYRKGKHSKESRGRSKK